MRPPLAGWLAGALPAGPGCPALRPPRLALAAPPPGDALPAPFLATMTMMTAELDVNAPRQRWRDRLRLRLLLDTIRRERAPVLGGGPGLGAPVGGAAGGGSGKRKVGAAVEAGDGRRLAPNAGLGAAIQAPRAACREAAEFPP